MSTKAHVYRAKHGIWASRAPWVVEFEGQKWHYIYFETAIHTATTLVGAVRARR